MKKRKILIIDDEKGFSEMVKLILESTEEYDVEIEEDSSNAVYSARKCKPDLILLDVIMAKMEGPDVAQELKKDPELADTPTIFLTATVTEKEVEEGNGMIGGHPFVAKPSSFEILVNAIERNINLT